MSTFNLFPVRILYENESPKIKQKIREYTFFLV